MSDYISREKTYQQMLDLQTRKKERYLDIDDVRKVLHKMPSADAISIDQANAMIKSYVSHYEENKCFDGRTNREIISEFVERDDSFAIMVDEVSGTINIELSLDFWNAPYKAE